MEMVVSIIIITIGLGLLLAGVSLLGIGYLILTK